MKRIIGLLLLSSLVYSLEMFNGAEYDTTDTVTVAWDAVPNVEFYEIKLKWIDVTPNVEYNLPRTSETQAAITFPRSGHFIIMVRSGLWGTDNNSEIFSVWAISSDPLYAKVDGESRGWRVVKKLPTPSW